MPAKKQKAAKKPARSAKKQPVADAMSLWSQLGPLAEAMRAAKLKMTAEAFAGATHDTMLGGDGVTVRLDGAVRVYSIGRDDYARMWIADGELVIQLVAPRSMVLVGRHFKPVEPMGWIEYRRPATRDPKPDLEANLGTVIGTARRELVT